MVGVICCSVFFLFVVILYKTQMVSCTYYRHRLNIAYKTLVILLCWCMYAVYTQKRDMYKITKNLCQYVLCMCEWGNAKGFQQIYGVQ